jgi:cell fate (sporulation/competence/biofilm development) regulator YlbF (YheA/YmcA/DUF963 family)
METLQDKTTLRTAARDLGKQLRETPEYKAFREAQTEFEADDEARRLVNEHNETVRKLQLKQQLGEQDEALMASYRKQAEAIERHLSIHTLMITRQAWMDKLQRVNYELGEKLDLDFAKMAKPAGGCC